MRFNEFAVQPKTPDQLRIDSLKAAKERAADALAKERQNQQVIKAQKKLSALQTPKTIAPKAAS
jgi:hypothetical protein